MVVAYFCRLSMCLAFVAKVMVRHLRPSGAIAQAALWRSQGPKLSHFDRTHISPSIQQSKKVRAKIK